MIGAPNAGKSTLVNALVGQKVAIVSAKAQTTRARLMGIAIEGTSQILLVDTPGIFEPRRRLDRAMVAAAWTGAQDADLILLVIDSAAGVKADVERIIAYQTEGHVWDGTGVWLVFLQPLAFFMFVICIFAECNRLPFDRSDKKLLAAQQKTSSTDRRLSIEEDLSFQESTTITRQAWPRPAPPAARRPACRGWLRRLLAGARGLPWGRQCRDELCRRGFRPPSP